MARHTFLGDMSAWVMDTGTGQTSTSGLAGDAALVIPAQPVTFWDSESGGLRYTDLLDGSGNPISSVTSVSDGSLPQIQGPDGIAQMWADASGGSGPRRLCIATDAASLTDQNTAQITAQAAQLAQVPAFVYYNPSTASYPSRPSTGAPVWWVGPVAPVFGGGFAVDGLDYWIGPVA